MDLGRPDPAERQRVMAALADSAGHMGHAAERLGLTRGKLRGELLGIGLERAVEGGARVG